MWTKRLASRKYHYGALRLVWIEVSLCACMRVCMCLYVYACNVCMQACMSVLTSPVIRPAIRPAISPVVYTNRGAGCFPGSSYGVDDLGPVSSATTGSL